MLNLDCISNTELLDLYDEFNSHIRTSAKKYTITVKDAKNLKHYAINKYTAIECRKIGRIETAMIYESICEKIYSKLSDSSKW